METPKRAFFSNLRNFSIWFWLPFQNPSLEFNMIWHECYFFHIFRTSETSRKFSMGLKYMLWVCKAFLKNRGTQRKSNCSDWTNRSRDIAIPKKNLHLRSIFSHIVFWVVIYIYIRSPKISKNTHLFEFTSWGFGYKTG